MVISPVFCFSSADWVQGKNVEYFVEKGGREKKMGGLLPVRTGSLREGRISRKHFFGSRDGKSGMRQGKEASV